MNKHKLKTEPEPDPEPLAPGPEALGYSPRTVGYSLGGPDSAEGRMMAQSTGRRTFYEDDGKWVIRGAELIRHLRKGAQHWNKFRAQYKRYRPIFTDLKMPNGGNFAGYDFSKGKFVGNEFDLVDFSNAKLVDIDAKVTRFDKCSFRGADLTKANLYNAQFAYCDFTGCRLKDAFLVRTLFRYCKMDDVDFGLAEFGETDFINTTLNRARGLASARHDSPSNIDLKTLRHILPIKFLRGVGLSDELIAAQLFEPDASGYHSCFISFSTRDEKFAEKLYDDLQVSGIRCWFAPHDLAIGAATVDEIDRQIGQLDKLVIILSRASLKSQWVEDEVLKAYAEERRRKKRVLLPVRLDDAVMRAREAWALKLRDQRNIGDFSAWRSSGQYQRAFKRLLSSLKREGK